MKMGCCVLINYRKLFKNYNLNLPPIFFEQHSVIVKTLWIRQKLRDVASDLRFISVGLATKQLKVQF